MNVACIAWCATEAPTCLWAGASSVRRCSANQAQPAAGEPFVHAVQGGDDRVRSGRQHSAESPGTQRDQSTARSTDLRAFFLDPNDEQPAVVRCLAGSVAPAVQRWPTSRLRRRHAAADTRLPSGAQGSRSACPRCTNSLVEQELIDRLEVRFLETPAGSGKHRCRKSTVCRSCG